MANIVICLTSILRHLRLSLPVILSFTWFLPMPPPAWRDILTEPTLDDRQ